MAARRLKTKKQRFFELGPKILRHPRALLGLSPQRYYSILVKERLDSLNTTLLISGRRGTSASPAFGIVHWNAPDFLLLNTSQLELLHPNSKIYVLDNGSAPSCLHEVIARLRSRKNVTLFSAGADPRPDHTLGLQFLLNWSASNKDEALVILDQDCILARDVEDLIVKLDRDVWLIGARDYVIVPRDNGFLKKGLIRGNYNAVHPSFMILNPKEIVHRFGQTCLYDLRIYLATYRNFREEFHGISHKAQGHILYLETRMHDQIPFLTAYSYLGTNYGWHSWYSSRTTELSATDQLDGYPVSWIRDVQQLEFDFMKQVHMRTTRRSTTPESH
jgi:hypothetical protein